VDASVLVVGLAVPLLRDQVLYILGVSHLDLAFTTLLATGRRPPSIDHFGSNVYRYSLLSERRDSGPCELRN
jgi:hypothetical protein